VYPGTGTVLYVRSSRKFDRSRINILPVYFYILPVYSYICGSVFFIRVFLRLRHETRMTLLKFSKMWHWRLLHMKVHHSLGQEASRLVVSSFIVLDTHLESLFFFSELIRARACDSPIPLRTNSITANNNMYDTRPSMYIHNLYRPGTGGGSTHFTRM
jgi:hypothetical protein